MRWHGDDMTPRAVEGPSRQGFAVRQAAPGDVEALVEMNAAMALETEGRTLDPDRVAKGVAAVLHCPEKGFYLVAEADRRVVGALMVTFEWSDWRNGTFWWVQSVYVRPVWRRRGVYREMHGHVLSAARSRGDVCGLRLYVRRDNEVAQRTYRSLGMDRADYEMFEAGFIYGDSA